MYTGGAERVHEWCKRVERGQLTRDEITQLIQDQRGFLPSPMVLVLAGRNEMRDVIHDNECIEITHNPDLFWDQYPVSLRGHLAYRVDPNQLGLGTVFPSVRGFYFPDLRPEISPPNSSVQLDYAEMSRIWLEAQSSLYDKGFVELAKTKEVTITICPAGSYHELSFPTNPVHLFRIHRHATDTVDLHALPVTDHGYHNPDEDCWIDIIRGLAHMGGLSDIDTLKEKVPILSGTNKIAPLVKMLILSQRYFGHGPIVPGTLRNNNGFLAIGMPPVDLVDSRVHEALKTGTVIQKSCPITDPMRPLLERLYPQMQLPVNSALSLAMLEEAVVVGTETFHPLQQTINTDSGIVHDITIPILDEYADAIRALLTGQTYTTIDNTSRFRSWIQQEIKRGLIPCFERDRSSVTLDPSAALTNRKRGRKPRKI